MARLTLDEYRSHFGENAGYLDFARYGPPSDLVAANGAAALAIVSDGRTDVDSLRSFERQAHATVAAMTGRTSDDAIVATSSTSVGLFEVAFAVQGGPDAEVLVSPNEFPANIYPWVRASRRGGPRVTWLATGNGKVTPDAVATALTPATTALAVSAVDFRTGYRADLGALREVLGDRLLLVDGIQGFGACHLDWSQADALVVGGQKWMRASWGTGFISLSERGQERLGDGMTGWTGVREPTLYDGAIHETLPTAGRLAMTNPDLIAAAYFAGALELIEGISVPVIDQAIQERVERLLEVIERHGGRTVAPLSPGERSGIISFTVPGATAGQIGGALADAGILSSSRGDYVRVSPHATTPTSSIGVVDDVLAALVGRS